VTPDIFLEMAGGVLHSLSYQQVQANAAQQLVCVSRLSDPNCPSVSSACGTVCRDHLHVLCFVRQQIWHGHHNMRLLKTPAEGLCTLHGCRRATCRCQQAQSTSQKAASCSSAPRCIVLLPSESRGCGHSDCTNTVFCGTALRRSLQMHSLSTGMRHAHECTEILASLGQAFSAQGCFATGLTRLQRAS